MSTRNKVLFRLEEVHANVLQRIVFRNDDILRLKFEAFTGKQ